MSKFIIEGGHALNGTVTVSGNKNAALKVFPACILTDQPVILHNIPDIQDVRATIAIMRDLGIEVTNLGEGSWRIHAQHLTKSELKSSLASQTRGSIVFSGPLLARLGQVTLPLPGGDVIGGRPLDTHVRALEAMGAKVTLQNGQFRIEADPLRGGGYILLAEASVTATENTVLAAVLAPGETIIDNAACEPHVQDLCRMLNQMGATIEGIGTNRLAIQGVGRLSGTEFRIGSDFMEVGSFIGAAAVTGGALRIENADPHNLRMIRLVYQKLGVDWSVEGNDVLVSATQTLCIAPALGGRIPHVKPMPWPGFPPDLMSIAVVIATQSQGSVLLHDWMYESRFFFVDNLTFMGARIVLCDPHRVIIQGKNQLYASPHGVPSPDIRAGMAMLLAALCADGVSTIHNIQQIDRGYERIEQKLRALGAVIERVASD